MLIPTQMRITQGWTPPNSSEVVSPGFEIETEMSVHASVLRLPIVEVDRDYGPREEGSESKLSTFQYGFKIL